MSLYKQIKVEDALKEHTELMKTVREKCKDEIAKDTEQFNDDIFLVRFCLSHKGDVEKTVHAVKTAIEWRVKNKDLLVKLATGWKHPDEVTMQKYSPAGVHGQLKDHSPLLIIRGGIGNPDKLIENHPVSVIKNGIIFSKEAIHKICDAETRRLGHFVKMVSIQDMKGGSIFDMNRNFMNIMGEASKEMELCYPQLVGAVVITNPLSSIKVLLGIAQLILPSSMFEKIRLCGGKSTVTGDIATCPAAGAIFDLNNLPSFLGGKCTCADKGGCIGGVPNNQREKVTPPPEDTPIKK